MRLLAIDPGPVESAYCVIADDLIPQQFDKVLNVDQIQRLRQFNPFDADRFVIEMIASYGMPVGVEVFETVLWIGRFAEAIYLNSGAEAELIRRKDVALHLCHSARANDANIAQALRDRFAPGQSNNGKGTKAEPGWFHGFKGDHWQAYALAVYAIDMAAVG
jgi:hypothetical protein